MRNQVVPQSHGVAERLHRECVFPKPWNAVKIRDRSETQNEVVETQRVLMLIKAVGDHDAVMLDINLFDISRQKADAAQHLARWIYDRGEIKIAGGYLVKHGSE